MAFQNGAEPHAERRAAGSELSEAGDVTITITGARAAKMLGRGDAEERIIDELSALKQRLDSMEAAAAQQAIRHESVSRAVQGLQEKAELLSGQLSAQAAELDRLRSNLDGQSFRAASLPGRVDHMQGQIEVLSGQLGQMQTQVASLKSALGPKPADNANGETCAPPGWRQRFNSWFW